MVSDKNTDHKANDTPISPKKIPFVVNEKVEKWIDYFTGRGKTSFQKFLDRGANYRTLIEKILVEERVPKDLYYLAMIESGFSAHATSTANAVGWWQFVGETAKRYGAKVNRYVDERRNIEVATRIGARYLKDLHNVYQSWYLAMAGYNSGEMRIFRAIIKNNTRDFWVLAKKKALPRRDTQLYP